MHGPGDSGAFASPKYARPGYQSAFPIRHWEPEWPVVVVDTIAETIGPLRLTAWRDIRDGGIAKWAPVGLVFSVHEVTSAVWPEYPLGPQEGDWLGRAAVPHKIRIIRDPTGTTLSDYAWFDNAKDGGVVVRSLSPGWFEDYERAKERQLFGHEFGHALGFGHPEPDHETGQGMMGTGTKPSEYEIAQAKEWYGL